MFLRLVTHFTSITLTIFTAGIIAIAAEKSQTEPIFVKEWGLWYLEEQYGPPSSDNLRINVYVGKARENKKKIISEGIGEFIGLPKAKVIFDCEENSRHQTEGPIFYDLEGKTLTSLKHLGYLRKCWAIANSELIALHYNISDALHKFSNNLLVLDSKGNTVFQKKTDKAMEIPFSYKGKTFKISLPEPEPPG